MFVWKSSYPEIWKVHYPEKGQRHMILTVEGCMLNSLSLSVVGIFCLLLNTLKSTAHYLWDFAFIHIVHEE